MRFVVAYDISDDSSRKRVAELLNGVLTRVQYSVFEGEAPKEVVQQVVQKALGHIDGTTDSVRVYTLCASCARRIDSYGRDTSPEAARVRIL